MKRYLSIVLDEKCIVSKTIIEGNSYELDEYISKRYNNSDEIRKEYDFIIDVFFKNHKQMIENIEKRNNKKYRGQIVILEVLNDGNIKRVKVLYKNDIFKIKNEILKNQDLMREYIRCHKKYFSDYIIYKSRRVLSKTDYEHMISEWCRDIKNNNTYYDICRSILKFVETKEKQKNDENEITEIIKEERIFINCDEIDDLYEPDREKLLVLDEFSRCNIEEPSNFTEFEEKEETTTKKVKTKVKNKEINGQISFFD